MRYVIRMAPDPETAARLNEVSLKYNQEIETLQKVMNESGVNKVKQLTPEDIDYHIKELNALKNVGLTIQECARCAEDAEIKTIKLNEVFSQAIIKLFLGTSI